MKKTTRKLEKLFDLEIDRSQTIAITGGKKESYRKYQTENWGGGSTEDVECLDAED